MAVQHGGRGVGGARGIDENGGHASAVAARAVDAQQEHHAGDGGHGVGDRQEQAEIDQKAQTAEDGPHHKQVGGPAEQVGDHQNGQDHQRLELGHRLLVGAGPGHDEAAVAEVGVAILAHALDAGEGTVFDGALVKGAHHGDAALLIGLLDLGLVGDGELGLPLGHGLGGLGGGLVGHQLQLVAAARSDGRGGGHHKDGLPPRAGKRVLTLSALGGIMSITTEQDRTVEAPRKKPLACRRSNTLRRSEQE